ncbi:MAG: NAD(P)-dependent alcohol dehydrogenase [Bdellovibrionales bacterium]|jgi:uncharacterized zinc-type alcohol dehydrogenase-like protein|nr:NAD(P)-dependent alcohol dehydrogenase [Bdellovibrionales bacterium]
MTGTKTKAIGYAATTAKAPLAPFKFERRALRTADVSIEILFCGVCHSDIHVARDEWGGAKFPIVPGHEIVGIVNAVGEGVTAFKVGDRVGVGCFVDSCRHCPSCEQGLEQYCDQGMTGTYNSVDRVDGSPTYGGYSNHIVVDEKYVLRVPESLPLAASAPLLCAGITLYSPLRHWNAGPGKKVAIMGLGGLGHMGVKLAVAMGAEVTVLSQSLRKQEDAKQMGAHHFYATNDPETFKKLRGSFDLIINTVAADLDWNAYLSLLKLDGSLVLVGIPEKATPPVSAFSLIGKRRTLSGSLIGGIKETQEMLDFCAKHGITCDIELIAPEQINEAYDRVVKSDVRYRFVIDISKMAAI